VNALAEDDYWHKLLVELDAEIKRLETVAQPDDEENVLATKVAEDPANIELKHELATYLISKGRQEVSISVLLDCLKINKADKTAREMVMDVFKKLGGANDAVKKGRKRLASLMF